MLQKLQQGMAMMVMTHTVKQSVAARSHEWATSSRPASEYATKPTTEHAESNTAMMATTTLMSSKTRRRPSDSGASVPSMSNCDGRLPPLSLGLGPVHITETTLNKAAKLQAAQMLCITMATRNQSRKATGDVVQSRLVWL
mmetsp:Transcript_123350/g.344072  ORF Transcript_123350/g.344072 Transcript_123350/m.344072 type:complete len:141 (-) Transcript_123350:268-690(-)